VRLQTLLPPILLALLLTPMSFAQTSPESPQGSGNAYGIELEKSYPGTAVLELVTVAEEEIIAAIDEAYGKGYKAAALRYAPELAAQQELRQMAELSLQAERKKSRFFWPTVGASAGLSFVAGLLCSFLVVGR
jgi:hypothetical protein